VRVVRRELFQLPKHREGDLWVYEVPPTVPVTHSMRFIVTYLPENGWDIESPVEIEYVAGPPEGP